MNDFRIGHGYDVHALADGLPLRLGGVLIEHPRGCVAHSDGDALIHALCDALLGAAAMGDIGLHFPDTSERFKGIDSRILLRHTVEMLRDKGYRIGNVDCTLCLQRPKIKPYIAAMRETLAETMGIDPERVSVKATTTERLGFVGREEGVEAHAVALVYTETEFGTRSPTGTTERFRVLADRSSGSETVCIRISGPAPLPVSETGESADRDSKPSASGAACRISCVSDRETERKLRVQRGSRLAPVPTKRKSVPD